MNSFSIKESLGYGWKSFKAQPWKFIGLTALFFVITLVISALFGDATKDVPFRQGVSGAGFEIVAGLVNVILGAYLSAGYFSYFFKFYDDENPSIKELFKRADRLIPLAVANILVGVAVLLGFVLLVLPGIYLMLALYFAQLVVIDDNKGPIDSMKLSWQITKGEKWSLLGFFVISMGIILLGFIALGVGVLIAMPVVTLAMVDVFRKLKAKKLSLTTSTASQEVAPASL